MVDNAAAVAERTAEVAPAADAPAADKTPAGDTSPAGGQVGGQADAKVADLATDTTKVAEAEKVAEPVVDDNKVAWPDKGFPPNWRERTVDQLGLTGEDRKKELERIARMATPAEMHRANRAAESKITSLSEAAKSLAKLPGKDAKPEEVSAFDKAWGVPEKADGYELPLPPAEMGEMNPNDIATFAAIAAPKLKAAHVNQEQAAAITGIYYEIETARAKAREQADVTSKKEAEMDLRADWNGRGQFEAEIEMTNRAARALLEPFMKTPGERLGFLNLRLEDGRRIGSIPSFVKALNSLARNGFEAVGDDGMPETGEASGGKDPAQRLAEITRLAHGSDAEKAEYEKPSMQAELRKLAARVERKKGRG